MKIASVFTYYNSRVNFEARFPNGVKKPRHIKPFAAYRDYAGYHPVTKNFDRYAISIHNEEIRGYLESKYTPETFKRLFDLTKKRGTFDYVMEKNGFVKTSMINRKENPLMSDLVWITDSCHNMNLVKKQKPEDCTKVLNKLAELYEGQQANFDYTIANPSKYKANTFWGGASQIGVGHCFVPQTKQPHKWFAKTRLESIGNYLQTAADLIENGFNGAKYGYKSVNEIPDIVVNSIGNCIKYLKAINYPRARSCGTWEEQTFVNSLTSDTAIINQGMRKILGLMYEPTQSKNLLMLRERVLNSKNGDIFRDKPALEALIKDGEKRIIELPYMETEKGGYSKKVKPFEKKCLERKEDSAMSFMLQTEKLSSDILKDSAKRLLQLKKLSRSLVGENGARRYNGDEYLNLDYHTLKNPWTENKRKNEAEWFLVSEIADGYGSVAKTLLEYIEKRGNFSEQAKKLLEIALNGQTEYINRSYARITPKRMTKSNGYSCPAYKLPEAYEAVTLKSGLIKYVPGAHTPLTWAESSLYKASNNFLNNLKKVEELGLTVGI